MSNSATQSNGPVAVLQQVAQLNGDENLQRYPALLPPEQQNPPAYPFGHIQLPATGVFFATPLSYVSVNQSPILPGHVLVMPRSNIQRVHSLSPLELTDLWLTAQHVARVLEYRLHADAMTFAIQDGAEAGQKIPCVHIHVIPRYKQDFANKDDIYDLIEKNVPVSMLAVASSTMPASNTTVAAAPSQSHSHAVVPDSSSTTTPTGTMRESLDDAKRVFRSRVEQAAEAVKFAEWMKEAGLPEYMKSASATTSQER
jgi:bis(5'-adenosyl)-triphosphatase